MPDYLVRETFKATLDLAYPCHGNNQAISQ
jgi:hypothetical protein